MMLRLISYVLFLSSFTEAFQQAVPGSRTAFMVKAPRSMVAATATVEETTNEIMWDPCQEYKEETQIYKFAKEVAGLDGDSYEDLWKWSVNNSDEFWASLMDFTGVIYEGSMEPVKEGDTMPDVTYFPNVTLNFAQNMLKHAESPDMKDVEALVTVSEARPDVRLTFGDLKDETARVQAALSKLGVTENDAVGAYLPNIGETVIAMLGTTSTGAIWSSCSPDFGAQAVADRFGQIAPKVLVTANGFISKGKLTSMQEKIEELVSSLPSLERVVVIDLIEEEVEWADDRLKGMVVSWDDFLKEGSNGDGSAPEPIFTPVPFSHPQFVLYSSGTTGMPKSIAHGTGNTLLQHAKELMLHSDLRPEDRMIFFTTCGWMMWNWMVSSLYAGAAVVCFDGFAAHPQLDSPWDLAARERITHMGTTPRYLQSCRRRIRPDRDFDLSSLRVMFSTGSPLLTEDFEYVYEHVKENILLASISGGTDICSCFALGNPLTPVRKSELQAIGLGLDVCAYDVDEKKPVPFGEKGELVCNAPFVAAPVCFFGDDEKKSKYRSAYFEREEGKWFHGDLVEVTGSVGEAGGMVIHGRSDTTLKPGGVRIGTAEVYRFAEEVAVVEDSLVIGEQIKKGKKAGDVRIVLFVKLAGDTTLTPEVEEDIRSTVRAGASDAHVPAVIRQVQNIPYTKSGKKVEIAVRDLFSGVEPKNMGALADPSAFDEYREMAAER